MAPAFSSTRQAAAFSLLLLVLMLLPAAVKRGWLPPREEIYSSIPWSAGPFPYLHQQIFEEKGDIDIAFIGSSHIWYAIDTPYVQEKLSEKLGRPAVVRTLCWGAPGFDSMYFVAKDLLEHRKVRLLVFYDESSRRLGPHRLSIRWFRFGDDAGELASFPVEIKTPFYFAAILGMPRTLLEMARPNLPAPLFSEKKNWQELTYDATNPAARLGSLAVRIGYNADADHPDFADYTPRLRAQPADVRVYSADTRTNFLFSRPPTRPWQLAFARKFARLAQAHRTQLTILHLPDTGEMRSANIEEWVFWPSVLGSDVTMLGIPSATLFDGLSDEDVRKLFYDSGHLNQNGQRLFTPLITPALLNIYAAQTNR